MLPEPTPVNRAASDAAQLVHQVRIRCRLLIKALVICRASFLDGYSCLWS